MGTDEEAKGEKPENHHVDFDIGLDDAATIPKGALDPVYEAKARVLNRAVGLPVA